MRLRQRMTAEKREAARRLRKQPTDSERRLWESLRANRLCSAHFRRQQLLSGFIVDFYCHQAGLVVEVDGGWHDGRSDYDEERTRILNAHGLRVLRVTNEEVQNDLAGVLDRIREALGGAMTR